MEDPHRPHCRSKCKSIVCAQTEILIVSSRWWVWKSDLSPLDLVEILVLKSLMKMKNREIREFLLRENVYARKGLFLNVRKWSYLWVDPLRIFGVIWENQHFDYIWNLDRVWNYLPSMALRCPLRYKVQEGMVLLQHRHASSMASSIVHRYP